MHIQKILINIVFLIFINGCKEEGAWSEKPSINLNNTEVNKQEDFLKYPMDDWLLEGVWGGIVGNESDTLKLIQLKKDTYYYLIAKGITIESRGILNPINFLQVNIDNGIEIVDVSDSLDCVIQGEINSICYYFKNKNTNIEIIINDLDTEKFRTDESGFLLRLFPEYRSNEVNGFISYI